MFRYQESLKIIFLSIFTALFAGNQRKIETYKGLWKACYIEENSETICVSIVHELNYLAPGRLYLNLCELYNIQYSIRLFSNNKCCPVYGTGKSLGFDF